MAMRRLLCLALVLVFLAVVGLTFVRVTTSGAYVARSLKLRLNEGMTRQDVHLLVGRAPKDIYDSGMSKDFQTWEMDFWEFEVYYLTICYDPDSHLVINVSVGKRTKASALDKVLESLGYPDVHCVPD